MTKIKDSITLPIDAPHWMKKALDDGTFVETVMAEFDSVTRQLAELEEYVLHSTDEWMADRGLLENLQIDYGLIHVELLRIKSTLKIVYDEYADLAPPSPTPPADEKMST